MARIDSQAFRYEVSQATIETVITMLARMCTAQSSHVCSGEKSGTVHPRRMNAVTRIIGTATAINPSVAIAERIDETYRFLSSGRSSSDENHLQC